MRLFPLLSVCCCAVVFAAEPGVRTQNFDVDPNWEGVTNRITRDRYPTIIQDFGYSSDTNIAGKEKGEIGGVITRSNTPAYYAMKVDPVTLEKPLSASGSFAVTKTAGTSGVSFGWFGHDVTPGTRPLNSLMFQIDGEKNGIRIHVRIISAHNRGSGTAVQRADMKKKDLLFQADGKKHTWSISYDPAGKGTVTAQVDDLPPAKFEVFDDTRKDGLTADRFGIVNHLKSGNAMQFYLDDLKVGEQSFDFASDPNWESNGSRTKFEDRDLAGDNDFGYSQTNNAGGEKKGEIGGIIWRRAQDRAWYADKVGPLDLNKPLHASGKVILKVGAPDSGVYFGWFDTNTVRQAKEKDKDNQNFIGVHIEGPTRIGHYFAPEVDTIGNKRVRPQTAPVLQPDGKSHTFAIDYDPEKSELRATLDDKVSTLILPPSHRKSNATFDRFGLLSVPAGGQKVEIYLDDLSYTAE